MAFLTCNKAGRFTGPASDATSWTIGAPTGGWLTPNNAIPAGQITRWVAIVSSDGTSTLTVGAGSDARWNKVVQDSEATSQVTQALFFCDTTEAYAVSPSIPTLVIASTASEQFSATIGAFTAAAGKGVSSITPTTSQGNSANSDPPAITNGTGASQDLSVICSRGGDGTVTPTVNPTNYTTNLGNTASSGTNGAATTAQFRNITVANGGSEDPGAYTVTTEQWVCHTLALYEVIAAIGTATSAEAADSAAAAGSTLVSGSSASQEAADSAAISAASSITGTIAAAEGADSASITGSATVSGLMAVVEGLDVASVAGGPLTTGLIATSEALDTVSGAGASVISGSTAIPESADSMSASGTVASVGITGSAAINEGADSAGIVAAILVTGSLNATELADLLYAAGTTLTSVEVAPLAWTAQAKTGSWSPADYARGSVWSGETASNDWTAADYARGTAWNEKAKGQSTW